MFSNLYSVGHNWTSNNEKLPIIETAITLWKKIIQRFVLSYFKAQNFYFTWYNEQDSDGTFFFESKNSNICENIENFVSWSMIILKNEIFSLQRALRICYAVFFSILENFEY